MLCLTLVTATISEGMVKPGEVGVDAVVLRVLVEASLQQGHHLGVGEAEQDSNSNALEGADGGRENIIDFGQSRALRGTEGQQEVVEAEDGNQEQSCPGLF